MSIHDHAKFLSRLDKNGYDFNVFYDVGANIGTWSQEIQKIFPAAQFEMFEPLANKVKDLDSNSLLSKLGNTCHLHDIGLSDENGKGKIKFLGDRGVGSSILILESDSRKNIEYINIEIHRMDDYVKKNNLPYPDFIKLDVQAAEMKVLMGADKCMNNAKFILLESWARRGYGPETPLFHELANFLYKKDYVLFEILSIDEGRDDDGTLRWFDSVFINKTASRFDSWML